MKSQRIIAMQPNYRSARKRSFDDIKGPNASDASSLHTKIESVLAGLPALAAEPADVADDVRSIVLAHLIRNGSTHLRFREHPRLFEHTVVGRAAFLRVMLLAMRAAEAERSDD